MVGGAVDGLVSGLSTSDLISQLMTAEAAPQAALKTKVTLANKAIGGYQSVNTKTLAVLNAAKVLQDPKTWDLSSVKSSSDAVVASVSGTAGTGTLAFNVDHLAAAHSLVSANATAALTDNVVTGPVQIVTASGTVNIAPADNSLAKVVEAINASPTAGVKAAAVQVSPGQYKLQLTATGTGAASVFTVNGIGGMGGFNISTQAVDAQITVGTTTPYTVQSATNTFTDVMPGVTFTAQRPQNGVTLTADKDLNGIAGKVRGLVDALNATVTDIAAQTVANPTTTIKGPLAGDSTLRQLSSSMLSTSSTYVGALDLKQFGVEMGKDGKFTFTESKFIDKLRTDPANTKLIFTDATNGFATRLSAIADRATKATTGTLTTAIEGRNSLVRDLNVRITAWDQRLEARQASLKRMFTNLETSLGRMKQQSSWLAGQIASLPSG